MGKRRSRSSSSSSSGSSKNSSVSKSSERSAKLKKPATDLRKPIKKQSRSRSPSKSRSLPKSKVQEPKRRKKVESPPKREKRRSRSRDSTARRKRRSSRSSSHGKSRKTNGEQIKAEREQPKAELSKPATAGSQKWKSRTISNKGDSGGKTGASENEDKSNKFHQLNFGKNSYGESYDYNVHIRVCLNCDRVRKMGLPKANTIRLSKLYNEGFVTGLQAHWVKRKGSQKDRSKVKSLFDRPDLKKFFESEKDKKEDQRSEVKTLSDRWKTSDKKDSKVSQVVKLDVKSIESSVPPTNGRGPKEGASKGSVKKRLGHRANDSPDKSPVKEKDNAPLTRDDRERLDPKFVPTTGRYFLHDDREDRDYFGRRRSPDRFSSRNDAERMPRRGGYDSSNRGRPGYAYQRDTDTNRFMGRRSSPDVWKHDKFGVESDEEMENSDDQRKEENPKTVERRKSPSPRRKNDRRKNSKDGDESYSGQQPFYSQLQSEKLDRNNDDRVHDRHQPNRRSPPRYRNRRSRSRDQLRSNYNRQKRSPASWRQNKPAVYSKRRSKSKSRSRSRSNNRSRNRNKTPPKSRRSRSKSSNSSSSRSKSKSPSVQDARKKNSGNTTSNVAEGNSAVATAPVVESTKEKIVNYENEDDLIEDSKAVLSEVGGFGDSGKDYDHVDMDLINKLTQGSSA